MSAARRTLAAASCLCLFAFAANAGGAPYVLPEETAASLPAGEGADLTGALCSACHSLDYIQTQPRGKGAKFWQDAVAKMINVYGAPIDADQARAVADYLGRTYG